MYHPGKLDCLRVGVNMTGVALRNTGTKARPCVTWHPDGAELHLDGDAFTITGPMGTQVGVSLEE